MEGYMFKSPISASLKKNNDIKMTNENKKSFS